MAIIEKDGYCEDSETGQRFAKSENDGTPKRKIKRKKLIKPADSDILFGLYLEKAQGRLTLTEISDATGWKPQTLCGHFKKMDFKGKAEKVLKATKGTKSLTTEGVATNLAARILKGAEEHDASVEELMAKTRQHFRRMKGGTILNRARDIKTVVDIGRQHYRKDAEEKQAGPAPVLNIAFLLGESMKPVTVSATEVSAPRQDSQEP